MVERTVSARMRQFGLWMAAYAVVVVADGFWLPQPRRTDAVHVIGAILPLIPLAGATVTYLGAMRAMDEFGRRVHTEGMMFAVVGTIAVTLTAGFLQWFAAVPTISLGWVWPIMAMFYALGLGLAHRRYR